MWQAVIVTTICLNNKILYLQSMDGSRRYQVTPDTTGFDLTVGTITSAYPGQQFRAKFDPDSDVIVELAPR